MKTETVIKLNNLNKKFYEIVGADFDRTRQAAWKGWFQVLKYLPHKKLSIADIGCGNGRFGVFLNQNMEFEYLGVDTDEALLKQAAKNLIGKKAFFENFDVLKLEKCDEFTKKKFDLIVAFGLMHHIPGHKNRLKLIKTMFNQLGEDGLLVVSFWRPDRTDSFLDKQERLSNETIEEIKINKDDLEDGDAFLGWSDSGAKRYVHIASDSEIEKIQSELGVEAVARYKADGKSGDLNEYVVWRLDR